MFTHRSSNIYTVAVTHSSSNTYTKTAATFTHSDSNIYTNRVTATFTVSE